MDSQKYVIVDGIMPIVFHGGLKHSSFKGMGEITSAGFCDIYSEENEVKVNCYGKSESLKIKSKPEDDIYLISNWLYTY